MRYSGLSKAFIVIGLLLPLLALGGCSDDKTVDLGNNGSQNATGGAANSGAQGSGSSSGDDASAGGTNNNGASNDNNNASGGGTTNGSSGNDNGAGDSGGSGGSGSSGSSGATGGSGSGSGAQSMLCSADAPALAQKRTQQDAVTQSTDVDGKTIDVHMSVFQPKLAKGECAPVLIKSHGYGGSRKQSLSDVKDSGSISAVAARDAWNNGYFIITFDQRGFGQTGGKVRVEDPSYEGHDIKAVLDYAQQTLGGHLAMRNGNPLVGALGQSYGGGFQLLGAAIDPRFDAIVPTATWYSLPFSLDPNGVPKTYWLTLLVALGASGSNGNQAMFIKQGFAEAATTGTVQKSVVQELRGHGLNAYCQGLDSLLPNDPGVPRVSAFFVQGAADTLFNMNNALRNAQCLRNAGNDVRVLIERTGHILPVFQSKHDAVGFAVDHHVQCGEHNYVTAERMVSFLDEKLRGIEPKRAIDKNCIVQNDDHGIVANTFPVGGTHYDIPKKQFTTGPAAEDVRRFLTSITGDQKLENTVVNQTGQTAANLTKALTDLATKPGDFSGILTSDVLMAVPPKLLRTLTNAKQTIPLFTAQQDMTLAGVPTADLKLSAVGEATGATDPIVFIGLGLERAGNNGSPELIDQQIAPLRGSGEYNQQLVGVSKQLHAGDKVDLLVYGYHEQYYNSFNKVPEVVTLQGSVNLPLTDQ